MTDTAIIPPSGMVAKEPGTNEVAPRDALTLCVLEAAARQVGMAALDALALHVLASRGGTVARACLMRELLLDGPDCSRLLNRLEAADFAVRLCGSDRRTLEVELLDDGWDAADQVKAAFGECARGVMRTWEELLVQNVPDGGRPVDFAGVVVGWRDEPGRRLRAGEDAVDGWQTAGESGAVRGARDARNNISLDDALAANRVLAQLRRDERLTCTQAFCLMMLQASGAHAFAAHTATAIAQAASLPRSSVRSALWALQKRSLL